MALGGWLLVGLLVLAAGGELAIANDHVPSYFNRSSFPPDFVFGVASAAYQYEGAAAEYGRGPSVWDTFTRDFPGKILDGKSGSLGIDFYRRYKEDVKLMKFIGIDVFRMSISWTRVLPRGKLSGGVNKEGIAFYNNLINELLSNGVTPFVTIFHLDFPQALQDEYGGFLSPSVVGDFRDFAELCFKEFGDRVKHWITINEPWTYSVYGHDLGNIAPGRCSAWRNNNCSGGNSATEPYIVAHHLLISHSVVAKLYKEKYQASQKGQVGITLVTHWMVPYSNSKQNNKAAERAMDFMFGWFFHPLTYGDYPQSMRTIVGKRLPKFTSEQAMMLKGSFDFLGLNYYTGNYASNLPSSNSVNMCYSNDNLVNLTTERNGKPIGQPEAVSIFFIFPKGLQELLIYIKEKYNDPTIYITETGTGDAGNVTFNEGIKDHQRIYFYRHHIMAVRNAIEAGVKVKGFIAWTFLDAYEWNSGYTLRFGFGYIDYNNGMKRYLKNSALWLKKFLLK